ncbi:MAG: acylphosphatase [Verrucomicrobiales bacterium]
MIARQVFYQGRVQGVGFRYTTKQLATGFEITGAVKNLADGRVEMLAQGEAQEVEDFLEAIRESALGAHIREETILETAAPEGLVGFRITG